MPGSRFRARALTAVAVATGRACAILTPAAMATRRTSRRTGRSQAAPRSPTRRGGLSQAGFEHHRLAEGQDQRRQRRRLRGRGRAPEHSRRLPVRRQQHLLRREHHHVPGRAARRARRSAGRLALRRAVVVPHRVHARPRSPARTPSSRSAGSWARPTCGSTARRSPRRAVLQGSEPEYDFDITSLIKPGANAIALKLYPNNPGAMLNQDFNDWTQAARDQNTGLKYPVRLHVSNTLALRDVHVNQANAEDLSTRPDAQGHGQEHVARAPRRATSTRRSPTPTGRTRSTSTRRSAWPPGESKDGHVRPGPHRQPEAVVAVPDGRSAALQASR